MSDSLRDKIAAIMYRHILFRALDQCECGASFDGFCGRSLDAYAAHVADAVIRELPELQVPQRFMLSIASQDAEGRRLDAASWLEKELTSAGLECGAGWVLYNLVDGVIARLNGVAE